MKNLILALGMTTIAVSGSDASTSGTRFPGQSNDPRITCGVDIETGGMATIVPIIEATTEISGSYRLEVTKSSAGGTSRNVQANAFSGSVLGNAKIVVDWPADVAVSLSVHSEDGTQLCATHVKPVRPAV